MMEASVPTSTSADSADTLVHSPVLDLLEEAFADPSVTSAINEFCVEHASTFQGVRGDEEHPLQYHELYLQYTGLLESKVEAFMAEHDVTLDQILEAARHAPSGVHTFVDFLIASTEYHSFVQLMSDFASMDAWVDEGAEPLEQ